MKEQIILVGAILFAPNPAVNFSGESKRLVYCTIQSFASPEEFFYEADMNSGGSFEPPLQAQLELGDE
jgi:hypothetical protein